MTAWLVIGFFVVLAVAIFAVAMRSGHRPARPRPGGRWHPGTGLAIGAVILLFGLVVPALVVVWNSESHARGAIGGVELTAAEQRGREMFQTDCGMCHTLRDAGAVGRVGPDLDELRPSAALTVNAIREGRARGLGQMPAGLLDGEDARAVADYVAAVAGR
jgi:mono/diheme cytochrome c family protein